MTDNPATQVAKHCYEDLVGEYWSSASEEERHKWWAAVATILSKVASDSAVIQRGAQVLRDRIAGLERENEWLRLIVADLIEGETAEKGTPRWHAIRNARAVLSPAPDQNKG